jgi:BioD-like phosphotransacetylase family protein
MEISNVIPYFETWEKILGLAPKGVKRIFIAATRQNIGKTTVALGLISVLKDRFRNIGFIKPVGQRYMVENGHKVDEDAILMDRIFNFGSSIKDMSPIAVERGYTERFIDGLIKTDAPKEIREAFIRVSEGRDVVIIEGTGHAGVGSVFDLSNAAVSRLLGSKVILVCAGGVGQPIDEVMLNKSLFDKMGVKLAGVIVNKVLDMKYDKVSGYVKKGLERLGVPVLGVMPYVITLDAPSMRDVREELDMHVICGEEYMDRQIRKVLVGAMEVKYALQYLEDDCVVITPGNRIDLINMLIRMHTGRLKSSVKVAGLILSGGVSPPRRVYNALKSTGIPTIISRDNTYDVASKIHDLTVKIKSRDNNKVRVVEDMVRKYVDVEAVVQNLE